MNYHIETTTIEINNIDQFPLNLKELVNLKSFVGSCCKLLPYLDFPEGVKNIKVDFCGYSGSLNECMSLPKSLLLLDISRNQLTVIGYLPETLKELRCQYNKLQLFPDLTQCPNLI